MRRSVFLPVMTYPDATPDAVIESGVGFAARHALDLSGWVAQIDIPRISNPLSLPFIDMTQMVKQAETVSREHAGNLDLLLRDRCQSRSVAFDLEIETLELSRIGDRAAALARIHDLVLTQPGSAHRALNEALIFGSGRPVILLPSQPWSGVADHLAVAWDGGRAAARALGDAMWLVERARHVTIVFSGDDKATSSSAAQHLADALSRRGVEATTRRTQTGDRGVGEGLQAEAIAAGADMLVMGGYGHSRLREFILGGATAEVLSHSLLPVMIAH